MTTVADVEVSALTGHPAWLRLKAAATELHAQVAIMVDGFLVGLNKASSGESTLSATSHL